MAPWAPLVGGKGDRAAGVPLAVARALRERGLRVAGFVQEAIVEGESASATASGASAATSRSSSPARAARRATARRPFCSMLFDARGFEAARRWLDEDAPGADVILLDEASKLEVAGRGHHDAIRAALAGPALVVLGVRADQLFGIMERFGLGDPVGSLEPGEADPGRFVDELTAAARPRR
jgi:nucleoside-triphosphatase THEP1